MRHKCIRWIGLSLLLCSIALLTSCSFKEKETLTDEVGSDASSETTSDTVMEPEESKAISFDFIGGKDVMPLGAYYGPHLYNVCWDGNETPQLITEEQFQQAAELGINLFVKCEVEKSDFDKTIYDILKFGEKYGIGIMPTDKVLNARGDEMLTPTEFGKRVSAFREYDAWAAVYLVDEPSTSYWYSDRVDRYIDSYEEVANIIHNEMNLVSFGNLYPMISMAKKLDFERYVKEWVDTAKPKFLIWDEYPFNEGYAGDMNAYIVAQSIIRKNAQENNIPFWTFIQAGDHFERNGKETLEYWPNEAEFNWNVNTALAYGAQGLCYFPYYQNAGYDEKGNIDPYRFGFIGMTGNKTIWYYYAQNIHKHIREIDHVLMNSVHKGVIIKGEQTLDDFEGAYGVLEGEKFNELQAVYGDAMVGCLNYNGKTALYVVNYSMEYAQRITLDFDAKHDITITQLGETSYVRGNALTLDMAAGEGILLVIE